ncbi:SDR family NAD(P)-dependent oxidoreductase [Kitasatospora sp. NPDC098663]|uniref:SDR family NAD(P)-dependent oxidoreductase n=1 Tax=Kitasatospora sp. NPDC098663 TaxID=3364096 RepID=UPI003814DC2C
MNRADTEEEAVAVVGAAVRLPGGVDSLSSLWEALERGRDLVGEVPADRFEAHRFVDSSMPRRGKSYTAAGGFLDDIAGFDADYFGISPKEAAHMDPQHRLLLELTAEAVDDAAIDPARLAGSDTAVYVGISDVSYGALQLASLLTVGPYTMGGVASSIAANRVSHAFDLHGPSMAVDTACSSSLVALDRACRTLREGTSGIAVCGGVNVLLSPFTYVGFSQASMLSARGRCASFSANADGFVRAEGGGVVLLKRLTDALADGDRVHAVILGTATNSDGRTVGLSLPNPRAQEDLLRQAYAQAKVHPDQLVYFEAHGTGTPVGDPLEALAIGRALGIRRITGSLPIGSVKTNFGHLEPASGIAGLLKAVLALRHRTAPASLHADPPHPDIDFAGLGLRLVTRNLPLRQVERPVVGVNSFGFGGSNAHAILTSPPPSTRSAPSGRPPGGLPVLVSARSERALSEATARMAVHLADTAPEDFYDLAHTSCLRRGHHEYRAAVLAHSAHEAAVEFGTLSCGERGRGAIAKAATGGRIAFVFSGNGSQWAGMGADLLAGHTGFRHALAEVDTALSPWLGWSVAEAMAADPAHWRLERTEVAQPLLFALQVALAAVLREHGIEPSMVVGHSVGEVAAAYVCGALTLPQAARVLAARSRAQGATAGRGRMAALGLPTERAADELARFGGALEIAGVNSPQDVTVAGPAESLAELRERLEGRGVFYRDLGLDYAFHSAAMDDLRRPLADALTGLAPGPVTVPLYSTVTGHRISGTDLDADYWWRNVRRPVRLDAAVQRAIDDGAGLLLEIGPHPVLRTYLRRIAADRPDLSTVVVPTLHRAGDGPPAVAATVAAAVAAGSDLDWKRYFPVPGNVTDLPAYPWQRERHWNGTPQDWIRSSGDGLLQHPLLGERLRAPVPVWEGPVEPALVPWLGDHRVGGSVVMPATAYTEMALAAGRAVHPGPVEVLDLDISSALVVPWEDACAVRTQVSLTPELGTLTVTSTDEHARTPRPHARATVRSLLLPRPASLDIAALTEEFGAVCVETEEFYRTCRTIGLTYGPAFQVLREIRTAPGAVLAAYRQNAPDGPYTAHPALLDGALQAGGALLLDLVRDGHVYLPASIASVRVWEAPTPTGFHHLREVSRTDGEVCWDVTVTADDGTVTAELGGCRLRRFPVARRTPVSLSRTVLRAAPHPDEPCRPSPLPSPASLVADAGPQIAEHRTAWRKLRYDRFTELGSRFVARSTATALAELLPDPSRPFTVDDLCAAGLLEGFRPLVTLLAPVMERHGTLTRTGETRWQLAEDIPEADETIREMVATVPAYISDIALSAHQGRHLLSVLRGEQDPSGLLTAEPSTRLLERFHDTSPVCRFHHRIARSLVEQMLRHWPLDRPLRILEVGAGTGGATAALLPVLPPERTRYTFTDVSPAFLDRAQERFARHDFVEYRALDLNLDPEQQGYTPHSFDLVVAAGALHTAENLATALGHVSTLLAPGGQLLGVEAHRAELTAPIFGTSQSLHHRTDTGLRPVSPLLSREQWTTLLAQCGYRAPTFTGDDTEPALGDHSVFLTAAPAPGNADRTPQIPADARGDFVLATDTDEPDALIGATAHWLARSSEATVRVVRDGTDARAWAEVLADRAISSAPPCIVLSLNGAVPSSPSDLVDRAGRTAQVLRALFTTLQALPRGSETRFCLVTRVSGATPAPGETTNPEDAAAWGTARCLANEHPQVHGRRIAFQRGHDSAEDGLRLARELLLEDGEDEVVLTPAGRFVPREIAFTATPVPGGSSAPAVLRVRNPGLDYQLAWQQTEMPVPGPDEVVVEVRAAALNYRDIVQTLGYLPFDTLDGTAGRAGVGLECSGVVVACGSEVTALAPGDRVAGVSPVSLATHTLTRAEALWPIPDELTFAEAATVPVAFCTVHYGLRRLAGLQPGETVLVHGAAGGVGLAAIQYAHAHGANVIATAGSEIKRDFLRSLGVTHVLDSRSLDFTFQIRRITDGQGVDVVLNSLSGEALTRGLEVLRAGGRFVELGKRDMYEGNALPLRPFNRNITFHGLDLATVLPEPRLAGPLIHDVGELVAHPGFHPLPHTVFPAARVGDAFRYMQHSRHIGKVVVGFDPQDEPMAVEPLPAPLRLDPRGTYLVTGGTSGFGAATTRWLADLGARRLVLVSRRGEAAPEAAALLQELSERGVHATARAADVCDRDAMRAVVEEIDAGEHPLRGIVHCAMQLDDVMFTDLTPDRFTAVLRAKMGGADTLDRLARGRDLDLFLLYSSASTVFGPPKQSAYVAANLYLESLARCRRQRGEQASAVAWGPIAGTGYAARNQLLDGLTELGAEPIEPDAAFELAAPALADRHTAPAALALSRSNWGRLAGLLPLLGAPRMRHLVPTDAKNYDALAELLRTIATMSAEEVGSFLTAQLTELIAEVLHSDPEKIDPHVRLDAYGLDSLMGTQLLVSLNQNYGIEIPGTELLRSSGTIAEIAQIVQLRLGLQIPAPAFHQEAEAPPADRTERSPA